MIKIKEVEIKNIHTHNKKWQLNAKRIDGQKFFPIRFSTEKQAQKHIEDFDFEILDK